MMHNIAFGLLGWPIGCLIASGFSKMNRGNAMSGLYDICCGLLGAAGCAILILA